MLIFGRMFAEVGKIFISMNLRVGLLLLFLLGFFSPRAQQLFEGHVNIGSEERDAIIYLPAQYSKTKAYPLVIFTHGMAEAGKNIKKLYKQGLPKVLKQGYRPSFDFIMVAVQHNSFSVEPDWLPAILADCHKRWKIDGSRVYLTGISAGGKAAYGSQLNISRAFAKKFAAIVVNSGITQHANKKNLDWWKDTRTPLWAIVGGSDKGYVARNAHMVNEINKRVPNLAKLTVRPGVGHGGWTDVYNGKIKLNGKNMWEWLYQFRRSATDDVKPPVEETPPQDDVDDSTITNPATEVKYIRVNIYKGFDPHTANGWNNWQLGAREDSNIRSEPFKYADGKSSSVKASLSSSFRVVDNGPEYGGGVAPAGVLRHASYSKQKRTLIISGLSPLKTYTLILHGSRRIRPGNTTLFRIGEASRTIETYNNHTDRAVFSNVAADAKGRISVTIESLNLFNYLNGFTITEKTTVATK